MKKLNKLKEYREKSNLSKQDLAYILDITPEGVSKFETLNYNISAKYTYLLSKLYKKSMEDIYIATMQEVKI